MNYLDYFVDRFVRLMADYSSDGVWNRAGSMMERDDLPISDALKRDIEAWCDLYESSEFWKDPEERTRDFDLTGFNARGEVLALRLQGELEGWEVEFFRETNGE